MKRPRGKFLFTVDIRFKDTLSENRLPKGLMEKFRSENFPLSTNPNVIGEEEDDSNTIWVIYDIKKEKFVIREEEGKLKIYQEICNDVLKGNTSTSTVTKCSLFAPIPSNLKLEYDLEDSEFIQEYFGEDDPFNYDVSDCVIENVNKLMEGYVKHYSRDDSQIEDGIKKKINESIKNIIVLLCCNIYSKLKFCSSDDENLDLTQTVEQIWMRVRDPLTFAWNINTSA